MATQRKSSTRRRASSGKSSRGRTSAARVKRRAGAKRAVAARKRAVKKVAKKKAVKKVAKRKAAPKKVVRTKAAKKPARKSVKRVAKKPVRKAAKKTATKTVKRDVKRVAVKGTGAPKKSDVKKALKAQAAPAPVAPAKPAKAARAVTKPAQPQKHARPAKPEPIVRPLGVLPPESRARTRRGGIDGPRVAFPDRPGPMTPKTNDTHGAERLSDQDLKAFEERLLAERQKILRDMGHLETTVLKVNQRDSAGDLSGYSFHMADAGTDAMEREKAFLFASAEGRLLFEINDALRRIYNGEYGTCETCGQPIARARLEAIPHARQCVSCKSKEERAGRGAQ